LLLYWTSRSFLKDRLYSKERPSEFDPLVIALGWLLSDLLDRSSPLPALVGNLTLAAWDESLQPHFKAFGRLSVRVTNGIEREVTGGGLNAIGVAGVLFTRMK